MLAAAHAGFFIHPPESIVAQFPQFPVTRSYAELKAAIIRNQTGRNVSPATIKRQEQTARRVEQGLTELLPRPQYVQATRDALLRMTTIDRYAAHASAIGAGWKTVDEVRAIEDLPPLAAPVQEPTS